MINVLLPEPSKDPKLIEENQNPSAFEREGIFSSPLPGLKASATASGREKRRSMKPQSAPIPIPIQIQV